MVSVPSGNKLYCSFCGKSQDEVKKLIAGPTVFICNECVELCDDIIAEESKPPEVVAAENELISKARDWLIDDYTTSKQKDFESDCALFKARVDGGHFDQDPRLLGYVFGLKGSSLLTDIKGDE